MSDVALKRKAATLKLSNQKNPLNLGFSLNNPRRVDGHTNQPQTQTPFRGNAPRGHGGSGGTIQQSQYICADSFTIPHKSVMNTRGMLSTRYRCMSSPYPNSIVKKCEPPSYELYLNKLKGDTAKNSTSATNNGSCPTNKKIGNYHKDVLKMNYGIYYNSSIFKKNCIPLPASKAHYPPQNVRPVSACISQLSLEQFLEIQANLPSGC